MAQTLARRLQAAAYPDDWPVVELFCSVLLDAGHRLQIERASGPLGRYDGLILVLVGLGLIVAAAVRFVRTGRRLDDEETHAAGSLRAELILSAVLALVVAGISAYLVLG